MQFTVVDKFYDLPLSKVGPEECFLLRDSWDDFGYKTSFSLYLPDEKGILENLGLVKISKKGHPQGYTTIDSKFTSLGGAFFSLGQSANYYQAISSRAFSSEILDALNDIVYSDVSREAAFNEQITEFSLLRTITVSSVIGQFKRIIEGGEKNAAFHFAFHSPRNTFSSGFDLEFEVDPNSIPPSNIHAIIGRNGVGKTFLLNGMTEALLAKNLSSDMYGYFYTHSHNEEQKLPFESINFFAKVISVSFSIFDDFSPKTDNESNRSMKYSYVGLRAESGDLIKSNAQLAEEFSEALFEIYGGNRRLTFEKALLYLSSDPLFSDYSIGEKLSSIDILDVFSFKEKSAALFKKLSSGHSIILLVMVKIITGLQEKTVIIIDEPESHLHPPLLSAFVRTLSKLLMEENAIAILATHSPVVLQELPSDCVWRIDRVGKMVNVDRPSVETFGENISVITRDVFGLEVMNSGFHSVLSEWANSGAEYSEIIDLFNGKIGNEAKALLRTMTRRGSGKQ
jgi:predicted ATPase